MVAKTETITCRFIGDFKIGDNRVRNADALCELSTANENDMFNKLMVIQGIDRRSIAARDHLSRAKLYERRRAQHLEG
jgi:hypothetical protein